MPLWTTTDNANGAPLSVASQFNKTPNTANRDALYGNTTADAFITGQTTSVLAVDSTEIAVGDLTLSAVEANNVGTGGSFIPGEILGLTATGGTAASVATVKVNSTKVRTVTANPATGSGYANGDTLTCNTGVMTTNAVFTVTTGASNTSVASLALTSNGVFTENPTLLNSALKNLVVANTSANGATANLTMRIDALSVVNPGRYSVVPTAVNNNTLTGSATGTGATAKLTWASISKGVPHTGWVIRTEGSGGRAGRVHYEVLVAGHVTGDGSDDALLPDA